MGQTNFISGVFSVYDSERALDFSDSENYPIGLELIFANNAAGQAFAQRLKKSLAGMDGENGIIYRVQGNDAEAVRGFDCFFKDTDSLRKVLADSLDGTGLYHEEEQRVIPRTALIDQAKMIMAARQQTIAF